MAATRDPAASRRGLSPRVLRSRFVNTLHVCVLPVAPAPHEKAILHTRSRAFAEAAVDFRSRPGVVLTRVEGLHRFSDQHQVAALSDHTSEQNHLAVRRHGEVHVRDVGRKVLQIPEDAVPAGDHVERVKRRDSSGLHGT